MNLDHCLTVFHQPAAAPLVISIIQNDLSQGMICDWVYWQKSNYFYFIEHLKFGANKNWQKCKYNNNNSNTFDRTIKLKFMIWVNFRGSKEMVVDFTTNFLRIKEEGRGRQRGSNSLSFYLPSPVPSSESKEQPLQKRPQSLSSVTDGRTFLLFLPEGGV